MRNLKLITIGILSLLALVIILQNTDEVQTRLLFMSITMPLAFLLFLTALLGFLIGILVSIRTMRKKGHAAETPAKSEPAVGN
jgi:uncharacterized integral membrane protein